MRILTYKTDSGLTLGIKTDQGVIDVAAAAEALGCSDVPATPVAFYAQGVDAMPAMNDLAAKAALAGADAAWLLDDATLQLGPCVANPEKILCVGLNYRRHAEESGSAVPEVPVLFSKFNNALAANGEDVPLPTRSN
jgi:2-keto-4-pentenoate hydratase/2-oxohepta-3-ene-1,7-dioic acid hydratase in catechol pathway